MQLIVTVKKLNKRRIVPANFPDRDNIIGEVKEGFSFEGEEVVIVPNPDLGKWYKDRDGHFYWGGGVMKGNSSVSIPVTVSVPTIDFGFDAAKIGWAHKMFGIVDVWNQSGSKGESIRIAVIDSGIDKNSLEFDTILNKENFNPAFPSADVHDLKGHGTQMAGIIAANGKSAFGIAPKSGLLIAKVDTKDINSIINAVKWAMNNQADIISMSLERNESTQTLFDELIKCKDKGIAIICAVGNGGQSGEVREKFPASHPCCYSIGACDQNFIKLDISNLSTHLKLISPGKDILTVSAGGGAVLAMPSTSIATAYTSGVIALLLSFMRKNNPNVTAVTVMEKLIEHTSVLPHMKNKLEYGNGVINPFKTFTQL